MARVAQPATRVDTTCWQLFRPAINTAHFYFLLLQKLCQITGLLTDWKNFSASGGPVRPEARGICHLVNPALPPIPPLRPPFASPSPITRHHRKVWIPISRHCTVFRHCYCAVRRFFGIALVHSCVIARAEPGRSYERAPVHTIPSRPSLVCPSFQLAGKTVHVSWAWRHVLRSVTCQDQSILPWSLSRLT